MGQQDRTCDGTLNRTAGSRCLDDGVATSERQLGANVADHLKTGGNEFQLLRYVIAQMAQVATTVRAKTFGGRINLLFS